MKLALIVHNVRSCHNVGSILRSAEGFGVDVYLTGYTPYPLLKNDERLPHLAAKTNRAIAKTALGAEKTAKWIYEPEISKTIKSLKNEGFAIVALEQTKNSKPLNTYKVGGDIALIVGREVEGIEASVLELVDDAVEIPMHGQKESFNVSVAAAIGLYQLKFAIHSTNG